MKINPLRMQLTWNLCFLIYFLCTQTFILIPFWGILSSIPSKPMECYWMTFIVPKFWFLTPHRNESTLKKSVTTNMGIPSVRMFLPLPWSIVVLPMKRDVLTVSNGFAPRFTWKRKMCLRPWNSLLHRRQRTHHLYILQPGFPHVPRKSKRIRKMGSLYKIRTIVSRAVDHLKINMCIAGRKIPQSHPTTKADVFLAGIASLLTVIVAIAWSVHHTSEVWSL